MNELCIKKCAYKNICNYGQELTNSCKVSEDEQAQEFKEFLLAQPLQNFPTWEKLQECTK